MRMVLPTVILFSLLGCGQFDGKQEDDDREGCDEERASIDAEILSLNHCSADTDCRATGLSNRYGCYFLHDKSEETSHVLGRVDAYVAGSCWDGRVTLTLLDCASVGTLTCDAGKCRSN